MDLALVSIGILALVVFPGRDVVFMYRGSHGWMRACSAGCAAVAVDVAFLLCVLLLLVLLVILLFRPLAPAAVSVADYY